MHHHQGYYRFPTLFENRVLFTCEGDIWETSDQGGMARRLTQARGGISRTIMSPDGQFVAMTCRDEGYEEAYVMSSRGGPMTRLTFLGGLTRVIGWTPDGEYITFATNWKSPFYGMFRLFKVHRNGGEPVDMGLGEGVWVSFDANAQPTLIGRHSTDIARWKRYKGGLAAQIWSKNEQEWQRLFSDQTGGFARPLWINGRIYYTSDIEGYGNLYSCAPDGSDATRHTHHTGNYVRAATTDGRNIIYARGGTLHIYDTQEDADRELELDFVSPRAQLQRKYVSSTDYLHDYELHPKGHSVSLISRGKAFNMGLWEGAVKQTGEEQGVRYRLGRYEPKDESILYISDQGGEEHLERHFLEACKEPETLEFEGHTLGRAIDMEIDPTGKKIAITNQRHELLVLDLEEMTSTLLHHSPQRRIDTISWSSDGRWLAFDAFMDEAQSAIFIADTTDNTCRQITSGEFRDHTPAFDPKGRYLYFVSMRVFEARYDAHFFAIGFQDSERPCLITLRPDVESPFFEKPRPLDDDGSSSDKKDEDDKKDDEDEETSEDTEETSSEEETSDADDKDGDEDEEKEDGEEEEDEKDKPEPIEIDFEGIEQRVLMFPVVQSNYGQMTALDDRLIYVVWQRDGDRSKGMRGTLKCYDLNKRKEKHITSDCSSFALSHDRKTIALWSDDNIRVVSATSEDLSDSAELSRDSGWLDLSRVSVEVDPAQEWRQMLREIWRLMRDQFWREDMSGVDWDEVWERYEALLPRISTRAEFSDLVWMMQGELGTSHAYEFGGDYDRESPPFYNIGSLGADFVWDEDFESGDVKGGYRITNIVRGDDWNLDMASPFTRPGLDVKVGDVVTAINGRRVQSNQSVQQRLVKHANKEIELLIHRPKVEDAAAEEDEKKEDEASKTVTVKTIPGESSLRYRNWVSSRRALVHERTNGRIGYIHIPDMSAQGYAEFHRAYAAEQHREALLIDVRNNGGGHVSQLILEKLSRVIIGYDLQRWAPPETYPSSAPKGPMVALTNAYAGSDGDIFSHCFKLMNLGPLMGTRTWGGVIGIWPRHGLVDGSITTQPEFSFWFVDVGFEVENYGTDPDIVVELPPEASAAHEDVQLDAGLKELEKLLEGYNVGFPDFSPFPVLTPPKTLPNSDSE